MTEVERLARKIKAMPPPAQLRLAAGLLEAGRGDLAYSIISRIKAELGTALALAKIEQPRGAS